MNELTKEELQARLTELGVSFNRSLGKVRLLELLNAQEAENEPVSDEQIEDEASIESEPETAKEAVQEATEPIKTATYEVITPVKYQGKRYLEGAKLRLNPEIAVPLLKSGAIR